VKDMSVSEQKRSILLTSLSLACLLLFCAACGTNISSTTSGNNPVTVATRQPIKQCGTIHTLRQVVVPADQKSAKSIEDCFWQAYQHCNLATLIYSQGNVDTATIHTFSLKNQSGTCVITDVLQHALLPHPPTPVENGTCTGLTEQPDGLHFLACDNEGEVLIPQG
jgi:hypothetical protein